MSLTNYQRRLVAGMRQEFTNLCDHQPAIYPYLLAHVTEVERWANFLLDKQSQADPFIVLSSVWLHDIGHFGPPGIDHAVRSAEMAYQILTKLAIHPRLIDLIVHCVRAHRNKDIPPQTLEAKILTAADSASHLSSINYIVHLSDGEIDYAQGKLDRDFRDLEPFPELKSALTPLYAAWKTWFTAYLSLPSTFLKPPPPPLTS